MAGPQEATEKLRIGNDFESPSLLLVDPAD
jgi:hypothetical protein